MQKTFMQRAWCGTLVSLMLGMISLPPVFACSRILWNNNKLAVVVGRTMDWPESTEPLLVVFPRGMQRDGGKMGSQIAVKENPARWTSKYGSLVATVYGLGTADGVNEKGLVCSSQKTTHIWTYLPKRADNRATLRGRRSIPHTKFINLGYRCLLGGRGDESVVLF